MIIKCTNCGTKARIRGLAFDDELILAPGFRDETGLNHYHLYCRKCYHVSDLVPSIIGLFKLQPFRCSGGIIGPEELKVLSLDDVVLFFHENILSTLMEDGVWDSGL